MILRLTTVGRQTLADGANRATRAVTLTRLAAGSGSGPGGAADDTRTALRNQRASAPATGATAHAGRLVARGDLAPAAAFSVTEVGLFAQVGTDPEILLAYWTEGGEVLAAATPGVTLVLAAVVELQAAAADVTVTLNPAVTIAGPATFLGLTDTPDAYTPEQLLRATAAGAAVELVAPTALRLNAAQLVSGRVPEARLGYQRYAVTTADVENTAAETDVLVFQIGANEIGDGDLVRLHWLAEYAANTFYGGTMTLRLKWGNATQTLATTQTLRNLAVRTIQFGIEAWRQGQTLHAAAYILAPEEAALEIFGGRGRMFSGVYAVTPAFNAAQTVAVSVKMSSATNNADVYYRMRGAHAVRWAAP